jgi:hypothetical protein
MLTISGSRRAEQYQRKDKRGTVHLMRGPFRLWFERSESLLECPLRETHNQRRVGSEDWKKTAKVSVCGETPLIDGDQMLPLPPLLIYDLLMYLPRVKSVSF